MISKLAPALLLTAIIAFTGCEQLGLGGSTAPTQVNNTNVQVVSGFAIIDLDEVAKRTQNDVRLQNALRQREQQVNGELNKMRTDYQRRVQLVQQEIGAEPTEEQQKQLVNLVNNMNVRLNQAQGTAQQTLNNDQVALVQAFRDGVRPIAVKVALERNLKIVLTKNEAILFAYDKAYDITEEVIKRMATPMVP